MFQVSISLKSIKETKICAMAGGRVNLHIAGNKCLSPLYKGEIVK